MESGSPLDRAFLIGLFCLGLVILAKKRFNWSNAMRANPWLFLLLGYMLVSIFWSEIPYLSFKRWVKELVAVTMACVVLTETLPREAMQSVFRRIVYILIPFSVLLIKYFPKYGVMYGHWSGKLMWTGVALHKNGLGRLCLIAAFFLIWTLIRRWRGHNIRVFKYQTHADVFILILTLWVLKGPPGAYPATAIVALAVGLATFMVLLWMKKHRINLGANTLMIITVLVIVYGIVTPMIGGLSFLDFSSAIGRDETLTGRTEIWKELVPIAMQNAILGDGYGSFWTSTTRNLYATDAHNGYLDTLLQIGFVGLFFLAMFLISCCRKAYKQLTQDFDWGALWVCFIFMAVFHNISESSIDSFSNHLMAILLFLAMSLPSNRNLPQREISQKYTEKMDVRDAPSST
jgi:exopolysaccharide production protein ExoQ